MHRVEEVLTPPSMFDFLNYTDQFTNVTVGIVQGLLEASGWDLNNLPNSLEEYDGTTLTLIAPLDEAFTGEPYAISGEVLDRLATTEWSRHLQAILKDLLIPAALQPDFVGETIGGSNISYNSLDGAFYLNSGIALDSSKCVDG